MGAYLWGSFQLQKRKINDKGVSVLGVTYRKWGLVIIGDEVWDRWFKKGQF